MEEHITNYITSGKINFLKHVAAPDKSSTPEGELPPLVTENTLKQKFLIEIAYWNCKLELQTEIANWNFKLKAHN